MPRKRKNRAPKQPQSCSEARSSLRFARIYLIFARNAGKNLSCPGRQKRFLSWRRRRDSPACGRAASGCKAPPAPCQAPSVRIPPCCENKHPPPVGEECLFLRWDTNNHTIRRFLPPSGGGCKVGSDYVYRMCPSFLPNTSSWTL